MTPQPTPMMVQFMEIKAANPDCLLFYRMGDFYELFFDDAEVASRALGIALTKRGKHQGKDIPMCGVPVRASDDYLQKLIRLGHKVAVCEQTEDPAEAKKRGAKSVVRREVIRLVTPGTLTEDNLLQPNAHNFLAALARVRDGDEMALASIDISTGDFAVTAIAPGNLGAELARLDPGELVLPDSLSDDDHIRTLGHDLRIPLSPLPASRFDSASAERLLKDQFNVGALDAFGDFSRAELSACGAALEYVLLTQVGKLPALRPPVRRTFAGTMLIDMATRANLELVRTLSGERTGSLLHTIDCTVTGTGGRLLAQWLSGPLNQVDAINARLDAVAWACDNEDMRSDIISALKAAPDIGRALARLSLERGTPRDLAAIGTGLECAANLAGLFNGAPGTGGLPDLISEIVSIIGAGDDGLAAELATALDDDLPGLARDGGFIRKGYSTDLDEQAALRDESRKVIAGLEREYAELSAVKNLKIRHNNVLGYFVEVTQNNSAPFLEAPLAETFIHRQTMASAMRFSTVRLGELESQISMAAGRCVAIELEIFARLAARVLAQSEALSQKADALARLDVLTSLAVLAGRRGYCRPQVDDSCNFAITGGRHPVVERALQKQGEQAFVVNDCDLSVVRGDGSEARHIWLLTGPNMAGKSTFLRQNALIAILAQTGSFVPAASARIGLVDRLFSRVGAADDLARGRSTFMVEMVETATILNQATGRSLVILDEIGRGTATFDGLSIAWACVEHLHEQNRCRALFATHFHELTSLAASLDHLANATMKVREYQGEVVFLHEVGPGAADRSYGIQVARLAGLPQSVIDRAGHVLEQLEASDATSTRAALLNDLPLFSAAPPPPPAAAATPGPLAEAIAAIVPDELTPRDALELVYRLKKLYMEQTQ